MYVKVKPVEIISIANGKKLLISGELTTILEAESHIDLAKKIKNIKNEYIREDDLEKEFGLLPENIKQIFFKKVPNINAEVKKIVLHGDFDQGFSFFTQEEEVRKLIHSTHKSPVLHIINFNKFNLERILSVEEKAGCNDIVLISIYIRNLQLIIGPICKAYGVPGFKDFYNNWEIFERNRLNKNRSWFSVLDYALNEGIDIPPVINLKESESGLAGFHISKSVKKIISSVPPYYPWEEAFGVSVCDLQTGEFYHDTLVHSLI